MSAAKKTGTTAETGLETWLTTHGIPTHREALHGNQDQGDLWVHGGQLVIEVKSRRVRPSDEEIGRMFAEAEIEAARVPQCDVAVLVVKRPGRSPKRAGDWWAFITVADFLWLLGADPIVGDVGASLVQTTVADLAAVINRKWESVAA
jgi:hypothetical protein